jgi:hypothetical protein
MPESRRPTGQARREIQALVADVKREEAAMRGSLDAVQTEAGRLVEVAHRVSEDPEKAHAEMGGEEFYLWVRKLAGAAGVVGLAQRLQVKREMCEAALDGCPIDAL